jgi:hypothetical protein
MQGWLFVALLWHPEQRGRPHERHEQHAFIPLYRDAPSHNEPE